jgi:hypothetical protein
VPAERSMSATAVPTAPALDAPPGAVGAGVVAEPGAGALAGDATGADIAAVGAGEMFMFSIVAGCQDEIRMYAMEAGEEGHADGTRRRCCYA